MGIEQNNKTDIRENIVYTLYWLKRIDEEKQRKNNRKKQAQQLKIVIKR